jgi:integrase/recombinase XerD
MFFEVIMTKKKTHRTIHHLTEEEAIRIVEAARENPRDYLILRIFAKTGMRQGECFRIVETDCDLDNKIIYIPKAKRDEKREVPVDDKTALLLKEWFRDHELDKKGNIWGLSERTMRRLPGRYAKKAGVEKVVSCHSFRRFFATQLIRQNMSEFRVQRLLGHKSVNTTLIYSKIVTQDCLKDYNRIMNNW